MRRHRFVTSWVYDIPGPTEGAVSHVIGGWQVTGIYQWQSGQPYTITSGVDNAGWGLGSNRAIRTGQPLDPPAGADQTVWFNPAAFAVNPNGTFGDDAQGRVLWSEPLRPSTSGCSSASPSRTDMNFQFRAEFFNLFNTVNFNNPGTTVNSAATFGRITAAEDPRIMQFGLKFLF